MKIIIEHAGQSVTVEDKEVIAIDETVQLIRQALAGAGFHPNSIKEYLGED